MDPIGIVVLHQADIGEYLRIEDDLWKRVFDCQHLVVLESIGKWVAFDFGDKFGFFSTGVEHLGSFTQ